MQNFHNLSMIAGLIDSLFSIIIRIRIGAGIV